MAHFVVNYSFLLCGLYVFARVNPRSSTFYFASFAFFAANISLRIKASARLSCRFCSPRSESFFRRSQ
jgi:hypothetical protein